ncbi:Glyoxylate reductase / Glyoxylate reductase / Hydroxypyruvate reductase [Staphylococcus aureus]|uniref:Glyoxylate reductase / Glyoxylate reductase / Hydroxypyruvate reductase n=1 Tax=Staphylococcus aureus TaxID=1280 RepID=A0A380E248_STAAU|nr:Glyoxylate reductase / Glyoxylate reductase / Hydroxypyruvate reductase [Staphylococcus aureus]
MLAIARRIAEAEKYVEADAWQSWGPYLLSGKMSSIQLLEYMVWEILVKLLQEGCKGLILNSLSYRSRHKDAEADFNATYVSFETLLAESDFIICTAPLTKETHHKFNAEHLHK